MFLLNDKPLPLDTPFAVGEGDEAIQYPANWLRLSSLEEKESIGITEVAEPEQYDDRFYWGVGNPKDLIALKAQWKAFVSDSAWKLLQPTDFMDSRKSNDPNYNAPTDWLAWRASVRIKATEAKNAIKAVATVEDLIPLTQVEWPLNPMQIIELAKSN